MKAVFLCAGYGTRLYPLTKDRPKALLPIGGKPLLNHLLNKLEPIQGIHHVILVSNGRFYDSFCEWKKSVNTTKKLSVLNDGTMDNEHRLGAIRDLKLALEQERVEDDVLILASDNLFDAELVPFVSFAEKKKAAAAVGVYDVGDRALATKYGLIQTNSEHKVTGFFEKPKDPPTTLASMGIYYLSKASLPLLDQYLETDQKADAPGFYIGWLSKQTEMYAFPFQGKWFDIGDLNSYENADQYFNDLLKKR